MEDHFDKLLYLIVGVIYLFINNKKNRNAEEKEEVNRPSEALPVPTTSTNSADTWGDKAQEALAAESWLQASMKTTVPPSPVHSTTTTQLPTQQRPSKKMSRLLHRDGGWKKAIIMGEIIRPYS